MEKVLLKCLCDKACVAEGLEAEGDKAVAAYAYCNQHGFWKAVIE